MAELADNFAAQIEKVEIERSVLHLAIRDKKREIDSWLLEFETREGRKPLNDDKKAIKHLYKSFKKMEQEEKLLLKKLDVASNLVVVDPHEISLRSHHDNKIKDKDNGISQECINDSGMDQIPNILSPMNNRKSPHVEEDAIDFDKSSFPIAPKEPFITDNDSDELPKKLQDYFLPRKNKSQIFSSSHRKIEGMRTRFMEMKLEIETDNLRSPLFSPVSSPQYTPKNSICQVNAHRPDVQSPSSLRAKEKWELLGKIIHKKEDNRLENSSGTLFDKKAELERLLVAEVALPRPPHTTELKRLVNDMINVPPPPLDFELFEEHVAKNQIMVSAVPIEVIQECEQELNKARENIINLEMKAYRRRQAELTYLEAGALDRVSRLEHQLYDNVAKQRKSDREEIMKKRRSMKNMFIRATQQWNRIVKSHQGLLLGTYGHLAHKFSNQSLKLSVQWSRIPQPIEIHIHSIRGLKDRVHKGRYVILVSMRERLGGGEIVWSRIPPGSSFKKKSTVTCPIPHGGRFFDKELKIEQSVYQLCPNENNLKPSNVLIFELFQLAGPENLVAKVVGWGTLPLVDSNILPIRGKFRLPVMRENERRKPVQLHSEIESMISSNLSNWLGNMYIEVRHLSKEMVLGEEQKLIHQVECNKLNKTLYFTEDCTASSGLEEAKAVRSVFSFEWLPRMKQTFYRSNDEVPGREETELLLIDSTENSGTTPSNPHLKPDVHMWHKLVDEPEMSTYTYSIGSGSNEVPISDVSTLVRDKIRYIMLELKMDLHVRGWRNRDTWLAGMLAINALWLRMYVHYLGQWVYLKILGVPLYNFVPKLFYVLLKFPAYSLSTTALVGFVVVGPLAVTFLFGILALVGWSLFVTLGSLSEWFSRFTLALGLGMILDPTLIFVVDVIMKNFDCTERCTDYTAPSCRCQEGDTWQICTRLEESDGAGIVGIIITVIIYVMYFIISSLALYQYIYSVHMNGRMMDSWKRLNRTSDDVYMPHDFEISNVELDLACAASRRWLGPRGSKREIEIDNFEHTEMFGKSTCLTIFEVEVDGSKKVHRRFLNHLEGAILEIFGGTSLNSEINHELAPCRIFEGMFLESSSENSASSKINAHASEKPLLSS